MPGGRILKAAEDGKETWYKIKSLSKIIL